MSDAHALDAGADTVETEARQRHCTAVDLPDLPVRWKFRLLGFDKQN